MCLSSEAQVTAVYCLLSFQQPVMVLMMMMMAVTVKKSNKDDVGEENHSVFKLPPTILLKNGENVK